MREARSSRRFSSRTMALHVRKVHAPRRAASRRFSPKFASRISCKTLAIARRFARNSRSEFARTRAKRAIWGRPLAYLAGLRPETYDASPAKNGRIYAAEGDSGEAVGRALISPISPNHHHPRPASERSERPRQAEVTTSRRRRRVDGIHPDLLRRSGSTVSHRRWLTYVQACVSRPGRIQPTSDRRSRVPAPRAKRGAPASINRRRGCKPSRFLIHPPDPTYGRTCQLPPVLDGLNPRPGEARPRQRGPRRGRALQSNQRITKLNPRPGEARPR